MYLLYFEYCISSMPTNIIVVYNKKNCAREQYINLTIKRQS